MHFSQSWNVNSGSKFLSLGFLRKGFSRFSIAILSLSTHRTKGKQIQFCFSFLLIYHSWFNTDPVYGRRVLYCWALILTQDVTNIGLKLATFWSASFHSTFAYQCGPTWMTIFLIKSITTLREYHPHLTPAQMWRVNSVFASDVLVSISSYVSL